MNDNTLKSGSLLQGGKYKITGVLGQGGFGITYEAEQVSLGRKVAVKEFFMKDYCDREDGSSHVTLSTSSSSRELVERFRAKFVREARMIAGLNHEHIVKIIDVFEENGTAYYVMEYLGGGCLGEGVKAGKAMPEQEALNSIRQIADSLSYLHKKGIIHFDVKPSNVLSDEDGKLKLIDFGISKHYDEAGVQTSSTPVGISKGYAPLEQYKQGSDINSFTPATDVYALGATLYALLSGANPPEASDVSEDGLPVINGVSPAVMQTIEKAMQPRRKDRPQSVGEFLALLGGNAKEDDSEETVVPVTESKARNPKSDKEKKLAKSKQPKKPQKQKESGDSGKTFPIWLFGVIAGVVAILIAITITMLIPKEGKIYFDSEPQGAEVWIDGKASGSRTPCTLSGIPYGAHNIGYKLNGYCEYNDSISVVGRKTIEHFDSLKVAYGKLEVKCNQTGMEIFLDGASTGKKTGKKAVVMDSVLVGAHKVEFKMKNYKDCLVEATVKEDETTSVTANAEYIWPAPSGKENGYDYMDLGLSVKWATCNVGASSPEGYGSYFAWGETSPKNSYDWKNLKYHTESNEWWEKFSKYVIRKEEGPVDNRTTLELSDDAVRANWGGSWRMPMNTEFRELIDKCIWTWTTMNGTYGYRVTSKSNGNSLFLPAGGDRFGSCSGGKDPYGDYWSSSLHVSFSADAYFLHFESNYINWCGGYRSCGRSVRPVCP